MIFINNLSTFVFRQVHIYAGDATIELINDGTVPKLFSCFTEPEEGIFASIYNSSNVGQITLDDEDETKYSYNSTKSLKLYYKGSDGLYTEVIQDAISN